MIGIQHLTKTFTTAGGVTEALKDVSLTIPDGEIYVQRQRRQLLWQPLLPCRRT